MEPTIKFNNGKTAPAFGYGTWLSEPGEVGQGVKIALETGYRHIDCAHVYGNEPEVGESFTAAFATGTVKREDVFITSKLWVKDFGNVKEACKKTLKNLQLDYLDLYLIHLPFEVESTLIGPVKNGVGLIGYDPQRINNVWESMEELVTSGLVKSIGVSNFTVKKLKALLASATVTPANNQVELNPYLPQAKLFDYCKENGITLVAYSPLGNPGRTAGDRVENDEPDLLGDEIIASIAKKHGATNAQVLLAWGLHRGSGVLVKSVKESRIKENFGCLKVTLDDDDMKAVNGIETQFRFCKQPWAKAPSQTYDEIWDNELLG